MTLSASLAGWPARNHRIDQPAPHHHQVEFFFNITNDHGVGGGEFSV